MSLTAIHEIIRTGENGQREVIPPKTSFEPLNAKEREYLLGVGAAVIGKAAAAQVHEPVDQDEDTDNQGATDDGLDDLTVAKLKQLAAEKKIDLGDATRKDAIVAVIRAALASAATDDLV